MRIPPRADERCGLEAGEDGARWGKMGAGLTNHTPTGLRSHGRGSAPLSPLSSSRLPVLDDPAADASRTFAVNFFFARPPRLAHRAQGSRRHQELQRRCRKGEPPTCCARHGQSKVCVDGTPPSRSAHGPLPCRASFAPLTSNHSTCCCAQTGTALGGLRPAAPGLLLAKRPAGTAAGAVAAHLEGHWRLLHARMHCR